MNNLNLFCSNLPGFCLLDNRIRLSRPSVSVQLEDLAEVLRVKK